MNAKQALKSVLKKNEELAYHVMRSKVDITVYNQIILGMINGESPCPWCEDHEECQLQAKDGKGCGEWMLKFDVELEEEQDDGCAAGDGDNRGEERVVSGGDDPGFPGAQVEPEPVGRMDHPEAGEGGDGCAEG